MCTCSDCMPYTELLSIFMYILCYKVTHSCQCCCRACCDYTVWVCLIHEVQVKKSTHQVCGAGRGALGHWIIQSVWCRDLQFLHWIAGQMNDLGNRRFSHQMSGCPTADLRSPANTCSVLSTCMTNLIHFSPPISLLLNILRQTLFTGFHQIWFFTDLYS